MAKYLSELFIEKPWQFGLRGDPFFWDYLEEYFSKVEFPYSETWFTDDIYYPGFKLSDFHSKVGSE